MPNRTRRDFSRNLAAGLGAAALTSAGGAGAPKAGSKPNIVFICSDQHNYKYTGYAGHPLVQTPNLDRIARQGVVFSNAYCGSPVCVPGRASMMTGMYPSDCNSFCNSTVWDGSHPTWGALLRRSGYETRATGKLDLNPDFDMGFREIKTSHGHRQNPDITSLFRRPVAYRVGERPNVNGRPRGQRHADASRAEIALQFLRGEATTLGKPWVHFVGFTQPHPRFVALKKYWDLYPLASIDLPRIPDDYLENQHLVFQELRHFKRIATPIPENRIRRARAGYYGMITEMDEYIGQLWDELEKTNQLAHTVFIYTSDHGEALGDHGLWYKNNLYDNAARVPLVIAGAALPQGKTIDTSVAHVDLIATMLEWAGAPMLASAGAVGQTGLRGHSLRTMIGDGSAGPHPAFAYSESHSEGNAAGGFMIRKGDWKYIHFTWHDHLLFNVKEDPGEFNNRIDDPAAKSVRDELSDILHHEVDPDEVTRRGFATQERMLADFARQMSESELAAMLQRRMGKGQARALAAKARVQVS